MIEFEEYKGKLNGLKPTLDSLRDALHLESAEKEIEELEGQSARDGFWNDVEKSQRVQKRLKQLKSKVENYQKLCSGWDDLMTLCEMAIEEDDDSMLPELQSDLLLDGLSVHVFVERPFSCAADLDIVPDPDEL